MKKYVYIIASIFLICLSSCKKDEGVTFGTVEYYPSFLWVDSKTTPVTKTFDFDFSQDAKDYDSYAEFQFVDNVGKAISTDVMQIVIDGKECPNNRFRIESDVTQKRLTFKFCPNAEEGKHQGYLKLVGGQSTSRGIPMDFELRQAYEPIGKNFDVDCHRNSRFGSCLAGLLQTDILPKIRIHPKDV